jgi:hypothetical protein
VTARLACAALLALACSACVTEQRRSADAAREAHAACVAQQSEDAPECVALQERALAAQQRYQDDAKRAWGCDPAQEPCPTPR